MVLDTCTLIWWTLDPDKLSPKARTLCNKLGPKEGVVSVISLWEIGIKIKRKKLVIGISLKEFVSRLKMLGSLDLAPIDEAIILKTHDLRWHHTNPADRMIVATAMVRDVPLVTCDQKIRDYYPKTIW